MNKRGTLRGSCRVVRPRLYGERDILVAEGWIPDRGKGGACVGALPAWIPGWGDETSLDEVGLALLQQAELEGRATFLPRRRYQETKVAPADGAAAFCVLVDEEGDAWRGGPGKLDPQGGGVYSPPHFPPHGLVARARGEGGE